MEQEEGATFDECLPKIKSANCGFDALHNSLLSVKMILEIRSEALREQLLGNDQQEQTLVRVTQSIGRASWHNSTIVKNKNRQRSKSPVQYG